MLVGAMVQDGAMKSKRGAVSGELAWMSVSANGFGDVRWEKIVALRRQIAAGTYFVSAEALVEKLIASAVVQ